MFSGVKAEKLANSPNWINIAFMAKTHTNSKQVRKSSKSSEIKERAALCGVDSNTQGTQKVKTNPAHRPTEYQGKYANIAFRHTLLGATDKDLAKAFEVDERTINDWKIKFPEFSQSIKQGKDEADANVANSLFGRAMGYSHKDLDIRTVSVGDGCSQIVQTPIVKHYPPDVAAQIFWLKNRKPALFRDKPDVLVTVNNETTISGQKSLDEWTPAEIKAELVRRESLPVRSSEIQFSEQNSGAKK